MNRERSFGRREGGEERFELLGWRDFFFLFFFFWREDEPVEGYRVQMGR